MSRPWRLTRRAERHLTNIAIWTLERFGLRQAELYETEILERCEAIAQGRAHIRSCAQLVDGAESLNFARAGEHFIIFTETPEQIVIAAFLHASCNLPDHVGAILEN